MKKLARLLSIFLLSIFSFITVFASTGELLNESQNISYKYFYGQGCGYCAKVDSYMKKVDGWEKLNIDKKEIYFDDENRNEMLEEGKRLGISEKEIGVPFLISKNTSNKEEYFIGDVQIINHLKPFLGEAKESKNKTVILTILALLAIIIPVFIISMSNKK